MLVSSVTSLCTRRNKVHIVTREGLSLPISAQVKISVGLQYNGYQEVEVHCLDVYAW